LKELKPEASNLIDTIVRGKNVIKAKQSWHYPPVKHEWSSESDSDLKDEFTSSLEEKERTGSFIDLQLQYPYLLDEKVEFLKTTEITPGKKMRHTCRFFFRVPTTHHPIHPSLIHTKPPHSHELLQAFSFNLFAKRTVEPITDISSFRRSLARRVAIAALQIRLNVGGRSDDSWAFTVLLLVKWRGMPLLS
jgi:hypothetical protein